MSAATPGAWYASALRTHGADPSKNGCDIGAENGANIAIVFHQSEDRGEQETIANARLVAAAPCLLNALQDLLVLYQGKKKGVWGESLDQVKAARAAIAAATGAQQ